jgi:hypothetical protein
MQIHNTSFSSEVCSDDFLFFYGNVRCRKELSDQIQSKLDDLRVVLSRTEEHRRQSLANLALHLSSWQQKVKKVHSPLLLIQTQTNKQANTHYLLPFRKKRFIIR